MSTDKTDWCEIERDLVASALGGGARTTLALPINPDEAEDPRNGIALAVGREIAKNGRGAIPTSTLFAATAIDLGYSPRAAANVQQWFAAARYMDAESVEPLHRRYLDRLLVRKVSIHDAAYRAALAANDADGLSAALEAMRGDRDAIRSRARGGLEPMRTHAQRYLDNVQTETGRRIRTGIPTFDQRLIFLPGDCIVIGAETNVGKTTIASQVCFAAAAGGTPSAFISVEDRAEDIAAKFLAESSGVNPEDLRAGQLGFDTREKVAKGIDGIPLRTWGAHVTSRRIGSVEDVIREAHALGVGVVVVDYLTAIIGDGSISSTRERVEDTLLRLLEATTSRGMSLVLCSQFSRDKSRAAGARPRLADLRETAAIEQAAQFVVLVYRPTSRDGTEEVSERGSEVVRAYVAKAKRGRRVRGIEIKMERGTSGNLIEVEEAPAF